MSARKINKTSSTGYPSLIWILWIVLLGFSLWMGQERCLYQDSAYALFRICDLQFPVEHGRWGMVPVLAPAWFAAWLHAPVVVITAIISAAPIALAAGISYWCWRISNDNQIYILPLLIYILTGPEWFYLSVAEMAPALCFAVLYLAYLMKSEGAKGIAVYMAILVMILAFFTHPGVLPFLFFGAVFYLIFTGNKTGWVVLLVLGIMVIGKRFLLPNTGYENEVLSRATDMQNVFAIFESYAWKYFLQSIPGRILLPFFIFVISILFLSTTLNLKQNILLFFTILACIFSVIAIFSIGDSNLMMEKNFAPIALIFVIPALFIPLSNPGAYKVYLFVVICLFGNGIRERWNSGKFYTERLQRLDALLQHTAIRGHEKLYFSDSILNPEEWRVTWALPYESAMRSESNSGKSVTLKPFTGKPDTTVLNSRGLFYGASFAYPIKTDTLNTQYFKFTQNSQYRLVTFEKEK
ncbi:MAG: hypothetical protein KG003_10970 [Bacteroidetes bacterium]|nr:hypothetical protein [Bacteroidota bacterium]